MCTDLPSNHEYLEISCGVLQEATLAWAPSKSDHFEPRVESDICASIKLGIGNSCTARTMNHMTALDFTSWDHLKAES